MSDQISRRPAGAAAADLESRREREPDSLRMLAVRDRRTRNALPEGDEATALRASIKTEDLESLAGSVPHLLRELAALRQEVELARRGAEQAVHEATWLRQENAALRADGDALRRVLAGAALPYARVRQHVASVYSLAEARQAFASVRSAC